MAVNLKRLKSIAPARDMDFRIAKVGHATSQASAHKRAAAVLCAGEWQGVNALEEASAKPVPDQDTKLPT